MEEIKLYIISDAEKEDQVNYQISSENDNKNKIDINIIKEDYKEWIKELTVDYDAESETYSSLSTITVRAEDYGGVDV